MAVQVEKFDHFKKLLRSGAIDMSSGTFKLAMVTSSYTFDATDTVWADISANEVANGDGYTTGGKALTNLSVAANGKWDADDATWTGLTKTFRRLILYKEGTFGGLVNPVLFAILPDDTPADVSVVGSTYALVWNALGIMP